MYSSRDDFSLIIEVLLIKTLARGASGAADQRERAIGDVRKNPVGNRLVVAGQIEFRQVLLGIQHAIRVRNANSSDDRLAVVACAAPRRLAWFRIPMSMFHWRTVRGGTIRVADSAR
jgi:hypothetical protein